MSTEEFKEYYKKEHVTGTYDKQREGNSYRVNKRKKELKIFLDLLNKKDDEQVLELGCSSGFLTKELGAVTAIDTSSKMLQITQDKNPRAIVLEADMFKIPFERETFDKVVTMRVWNHLDEDDLRRALKEARRVLKYEGFLIFDMEEKNLLRKIINFFYKRIKHVTGFKIYQYSTVEMAGILTSEGFTNLYCESLNHRIGRQVVWKVQKKLEEVKNGTR